MQRVLILFGQPDDPEAFDRHYREVHVPLAQAIPHVASYTYSAAPPAGADGSAPYHLVATFDFASEADMGAALASPEGAAATADVAGFASGGATVLTMTCVSPDA